MNESREAQLDKLRRMKLDTLQQLLDDWKLKSKILSDPQIDFLRTLADKNTSNLSYKQELNDNQRKMKTSIHQKLRDGFSDINQMIDLGFIGSVDHLSPYFYGNSEENRYPYDINTWREDFPVEKVSQFVACLVKMYGDDYALPLAEAIRKGLEEKDIFRNEQVDVPIIRRMRQGLF